MDQSPTPALKPGAPHRKPRPREVTLAESTVSHGCDQAATGFFPGSARRKLALKGPLAHGRSALSKQLYNVDRVTSRSGCPRNQLDREAETGALEGWSCISPRGSIPLPSTGDKFSGLKSNTQLLFQYRPVHRGFVLFSICLRALSEARSL